MAASSKCSVISFLSRVYDSSKPSHAMRLSSGPALAAWRKEFRKALIDLLRLDPAPSRPPCVRCGKTEELEDHIRESVEIETLDGLWMPAYVLVPKKRQTEALPAVIALHGHVMAAKEGTAHAFGEDNKELAERTQRMKGDYGYQAVRHGIISFVPDVSCFGQRLDEPVQGGSVCLKAFLNALLLGKTLLGIRVQEVLRAVDYLRLREDVHPERIGCIGLSGGGTQTLFAAALDERISAAVVSGFLCRFKDSLLDIVHCACNYVPGLARICDMGDIAGLIAPRPLFVESGRSDPIFPSGGAVAEFRRAQKAYELLGAKEHIQMEVFEGEHRFSGSRSIPWLREQLSTTAKGAY